mmetsp:Transcript_1982/g.2653  ORF Transcript_1982/g.2653 Transcript_1982/m.2653 type:complete len:352 (+) Transcript_1982:68-1123(+)
MEPNNSIQRVFQIGFILLSFALAVECFLPKNGAFSPMQRTKPSSTLRMMENRRHFISAGILGISSVLLSPSRSNAKVYFEIEKYGDKELKIATINKLKQNLRNVMGKDPSLIPEFFKLALLDGLGYDVKTNAGGLDGAVDLKDNPDLQKALDEVLQIKRKLQRTNELSLADIIAFAGAEAVETVGGPRIVVQLGRNDNNNIPEGFSFSEISIETFKKAGLGAREACLLLAALGELEFLSQKAIQSMVVEEEDEDDYGIDGPDGTADIPGTFGGAADIYGKMIGKDKFGTAFLEASVKGKINTPISKAILGDELMKPYAQKYAGNKGAFVKDVNEAYSKFSLLGSTFINRNA